MSASRLLYRGALVFALIAIPNICLACPACVDPRETNRWAFLSMTMFMSLLPLGMFGALVFWLRRRVKAVEEISTKLNERGDELAPGE